MPHRRPKNSIVLAAVAAVAVATPFAVQALGSDSGIRSASDASQSIPTQIAEVVLASVPDIVIPVKELTGLDIPDIHLRDLPLSTEIPLPGTGSLDLPSLTAPATPGDVATPAPEPETVAPDPATQLGAAVKEITREDPFSMVALTAPDLGSSIAQIRAKLADGSWGEWYTPDVIDSGSADMPSGKQGTEPVFVGETNTVQILVTPQDGAAPTAPLTPSTPAAPADPSESTEPTESTDPALRAPEAPAAETEADPTPLGYTPAAVSKPLRQSPVTVDDIAAVLINPGTGPQDGNLADIATPTSVNGVNIISRAAWGADERIRCQAPVYDGSTGGATVHHTAENNNYTREQSAGIVRGIYAYHAKQLGWCDIGYNVLVDRFGQIFEGRFGGLDRPVQGAHAGGFNENTVGIAMMGNFVSQPAPAATIESVGKYLGWRLKLAGLNPKGQVTMYSEGTQYSKYALGQKVVLPTIFAHRDVGYTECPGGAAYAQMNQIRDIAAANYGGNVGGSKPPTNPSTGGGVNPAPAPGGSADLNAQIPGVVNGILSLADSNPIARQWLAMGGNRSMVGDAITGLLTTATGQVYAIFQNGAIFTSPLGGVVTMIGKIFETWQSAGGVLGNIGLPISDEYSVDGGKRSDFERGSMIFDEVTGQVTTVLNDVAAPAAVSEAPVQIN